jgi:hypothetical protein
MTMNSLFNDCVHLLQAWGKFLHMTYEEINIWIFVIIEPVVFIIMLFVLIAQRRVIVKLKRENKQGVQKK